jgi:hypothetical protein
MKVFSMACALISLVASSALANLPTKLPQKSKAQIQQKKKNESLRQLTSEAPAAQQSVIAPRKTTGAWIQQRLSAGVFISTASEFKSSSGNGSDEEGNFTIPSNTLNSSTSIGVEARLQDQISGGLGWYSALSIDQTRAIGSISANGITANFPEDFKITPIVLSGGPRVQINKDFYVLGGLNRAIITNTGSIKNIGFTAEPLMGYQFGVGVQPQKNLALELNYRNLRYDFKFKSDSSTTNINEATLSGLNLQGSYKF